MQNPVVDILKEIRDNLRENTSYAARTAANTKIIRQDVSGIRQGRTGADAKPLKDPLPPGKRRQVDEVKRRYYEKISKFPNYSLFSIAKAVFDEDRRKHVRTGYDNIMALYHRANTEINRELDLKE